MWRTVRPRHAAAWVSMARQPTGPVDRSEAAGLSTILPMSDNSQGATVSTVTAVRRKVGANGDWRACMLSDLRFAPSVVAFDLIHT